MRLNSWALFFTFLLFLSACQSEMEQEQVLSRDKMVEVLYDYQVATALATQSSSLEGQKEGLRLKLSVFVKHHITQEEFDRSLAFYSRNSDEMKEVYREMQRRYNVQGSFLEEQGMKDNKAALYDTLTIWNKRFATLNAIGHNRLSTSITPGNKLKQEDELVFRFGVSWQYRQGMTQAHTLLSVELDNDSVLTTSGSLYSYMNTQELRIKLNSSTQVKRVTMQVYQMAKWGTDMQLLFLRNIQLLRIRAKRTPEETNSPSTDGLTPSGDTLSTNTNASSKL